MRINRNKEQRRTVHMQISDHMTTVHIPHDMFNRGESHVHMRSIMHHQNDPGNDLQRQTKGQYNAPDPHPIEVFRGRDH